MKKIFTLIATALIAIGANAQVLINYPSSTDGITYTKEGSYDNTTVAGSVKIDGTATNCLQLKNGVVSKDKNTGEITSINYIKLTTDGGFKAGDVITVAGVLDVKTDDGNYSSKIQTGPWLVTDVNVEDGKYTDVHKFNAFPNLKEAGVPTDDSFTLTEAAEALYLIRNGGTTVNITKIFVSRNGATPDPDPEPQAKLGEWNFSEWTAGDYKENIVKDGLTITAMAPTTNSEGGTSNHNVVIDANNKTVDGIKYTQRVKTGGKGSADARSFAFNVSGNSTIKVICCSASTSEDRKLNVVVKGQVLAELDALGNNTLAQTYEYVGEAADIFLESATSGVNVYAIYATNVTGNAPDIEAELAFEKGTDGINNITTTAASVKKSLRNGQIVIETANGTFNAVGAQVK